MSRSPLMRTLLLGFGRRGVEYAGRSLAPRPLTVEEMTPIAPGLSVLLEEAIKNGTYPNGAETQKELAVKGLIKGPADAQLT